MPWSPENTAFRVITGEDLCVNTRCLCALNQLQNHCHVVPSTPGPCHMLCWEPLPLHPWPPALVAHQMHLVWEALVTLI